MKLWTSKGSHKPDVLCLCTRKTRQESDGLSPHSEVMLQRIAVIRKASVIFSLCITLAWPLQVVCDGCVMILQVTWDDVIVMMCFPWRFLGSFWYLLQPFQVLCSIKESSSIGAPELGLAPICDLRRERWREFWQLRPCCEVYFSLASHRL